ncbi:MAG: hypothetical protein IPP37_06530 [Saprospiraceae bacterium]|nr:hypothetical protein [Saprospiraceae bacterium]
MVPPQLVADPATTGVTVALMLQLPAELFVKVRFGESQAGSQRHNLPRH